MQFKIKNVIEIKIFLYNILYMSFISDITFISFCSNFCVLFVPVSQTKSRSINVVVHVFVGFFFLEKS